DGDMLALLSDRVDVLRPGLSPELYHREDFERKNGFPPESLVLFKALTGDRSNNVRGLSRFPKKAARLLAARCGTVGGLYEALKLTELPDCLATLTSMELQKLLDGEAQVRSNVRLLDLLADPAAPHLHVPQPDRGPLIALLRPLQLVHLITPPFREDRLEI